jgi:hypothetical protein
MAKGPLVVRWGDWSLDEPHAGALGRAEAELENAGTVCWDGGITLGPHWLDERGNAIVWDAERVPLPPLAPGERTTVRTLIRAPIPPGRYRIALDLVLEHRAWFSELGSEMAVTTVDVRPRAGAGRADLPPWVEPAPDWAERVAAAHAEGYAVVAGAIAWEGGFLRRRPKALAAYEPGPGRVPGFQDALLCPSVLDGVELERLPDVEGLPAFAAPPPGSEPWIYDGRIVLRARPRSGRRRG